MIIDYNLERYAMLSEDNIQTALRKIVENKNLIICGLDEHGIMQGVFTNGDFLRWVSTTTIPDLEQPISTVLNTSYLSAPIDGDVDHINSLLEKVDFIPLVDSYQRLIGVARKHDGKVYIEDHIIGDSYPTFIIAEIGINHNGSLILAKQLIELSASAGVDCVKFQMRSLTDLYSNQGNVEDASENLGSQYTLDLLNRFQLTNEEMFEAFDYCRTFGLIPLCTPWDLESLGSLEEYGVPAYKVASADLTNDELLTAISATRKPMIVSTGMSEEEEIQHAVRLLRSKGASYILLHCNSTYPAPFKDINLRYLARLKEISQVPVGYSGHERDIYIAVAAVSLGATVIEKHITLDRNMEGNDHKVSLLPEEFKQMVKGIRQVEEALGTDSRRSISPGERLNRTTLAKSLIINQDLKKGDLITRNMIDIKSPGRGLQPNQLERLVGTQAMRDLRAGDFFYPSDLESTLSKPRDYTFKRKWGIPVRYYDYKKLCSLSNPDFLEFHLSYKDMDLDHHQFFDEPLDLDFTVHSPDLFSGDHLLDLAAKDDYYRSQSIAELQRVIDITLELKQYFKRATVPLVIVSMGGSTRTGLVAQSERPQMYKRVADSLAQLNKEGVEVIAQTLPPFPWYFGGQMFLNLFVDPSDTAEFCETYGYRLCFDVSHSKLAANYFNWSFSELVEKLAPFTTHLHLVDARGQDDEGVQIEEGTIDFSILAKQLERLAPTASFIPEIWQGHENDGNGFWVALERLEKYF